MGALAARADVETASTNRSLEEGERRTLVHRKGLRDTLGAPNLKT